MKRIPLYKIINFGKNLCGCRRTPDYFTLLHIDGKRGKKCFENELKYVYFGAVLIELL